MNRTIKMVAAGVAALALSLSLVAGAPSTEAATVSESSNSSAAGLCTSYAYSPYLYSGVVNNCYASYSYPVTYSYGYNNLYNYNNLYAYNGLYNNSYAAAAYYTFNPYLYGSSAYTSPVVYTQVPSYYSTLTPITTTYVAPTNYTGYVYPNSFYTGYYAGNGYVYPGFSTYRYYR